jgi:hypothetical protein
MLRAFLNMAAATGRSCVAAAKPAAAPVSGLGLPSAAPRSLGSCSRAWGQWQRPGLGASSLGAARWAGLRGRRGCQRQAQPDLLPLFPRWQQLLHTACLNMLVCAQSRFPPADRLVQHYRRAMQLEVEFFGWVLHPLAPAFLTAGRLGRQRHSAACCTPVTPARPPSCCVPPAARSRTARRRAPSRCWWWTLTTPAPPLVPPCRTALPYRLAAPASCLCLQPAPLLACPPVRPTTRHAALLAGRRRVEASPGTLSHMLPPRLPASPADSTGLVMQTAIEATVAQVAGGAAAAAPRCSHAALTGDCRLLCPPPCFSSHPCHTYPLPAALTVACGHPSTLSSACPHPRLAAGSSGRLDPVPLYIARPPPPPQKKQTPSLIICTPYPSLSASLLPPHPTPPSPPASPP